MASATNELVRGKLGASSFRKMGLGVAITPSGIVGQGITNAVDARATKIDITIDRHGEFLQFEDNGMGMRRQVWPEFIGMAESSKQGDDSTIGENGTGHTALWLAFDHMDVWTAWSEDPDCHHLSYSHDEAWKASQTGASGGIKTNKIPKSTSGARVKGTGTVIRLTKPWQGKSAIRVLPGEVLRNIARVLSPWQLDMITINGEKPRIDFPKGEFYRAQDEVPGVGQVEIIAGFADDQVKDQDRSWGTWGAHVCSHSELLDQLGRLEAGLAPELLHPNVWFMIRVHAWKNFEGEHTRRFFKPLLFKDPSFKLVVQHVHSTLLPEIRRRARLDTQVEGASDEVIERVVQRLIEKVGETTQVNVPPPRTPTTALAFKPARVTLVCGTTFVFQVLNAGAEDICELDATQSGGSILVDDKWLSGAKATATLTGPTQITYRAGKEEGRRYKMKLVGHASEGEEITPSAVCEIRLDQELAFTLSPRELVLEPGETGTVRVVNDDGKSGLTWTTTEKGRIRMSDDTRSAEVTAPMEPGNYTITCKASDGSKAEARLSVRTAKPRTGDGPGTAVLKKVLVVDGVTFTITSLPFAEQKNQRTKLAMFVPAGDTRCTIWFNFAAPEAQAAKKDRAGSLDLLVNHEVVTHMAIMLCERAAKQEGNRVPVNMMDVLRKRDTIMARIHQT